MRITLLSAVLAGAVGCGGSHGDCRHEPGNYLSTVRPTLTNGCKVFAEDVVQTNYVPGMDNPNCQGTIDWSDDMCKATFDQTCVRSDATVNHRGTLNFSRDGSRANGIETFMQTSATMTTPCYSTIEITYTRL